jgi:putative phage-type endonuclease
MLINQDFTQDRTKYIGGSDIGAILGLSKFRTPLQVWLEKTGQDLGKLDSLPLRFGSFAESFVATEYSRSTGFELIHDESAFIHPQHTFMSAHIDRLVLECNGQASPTRILECKTANPFAQLEWGEAGSDQVPMSYLCQCIWYMAITGIEKTDLAVLFGNNDFRIYEIIRDQELEELVLQRAISFWDDYVLKGTPPPAVNEADCHSLFSKGDPEKSAYATEAIMTLTKRFRILNSEIEVREQEISSIKQIIMAQMGDAEKLTYQGQIVATWKAPKQSYRLDSKRLELEHPDLVSSYQMPIQNSRRLVIKGPKGVTA